MALNKRLAMRRKIRETSEKALAANPPLSNAEQPTPTGPATQPAQPEAPQTPLPASTPAERAFAAETLMPDIADLPEVPLESVWPTHSESGEQQPSAPEPRRAAPDDPNPHSQSETSSYPSRSADPAAPHPTDEQWQLPQWQYATKRARINQRRQGK